MNTGVFKLLTIAILSCVFINSANANSCRLIILGEPVQQQLELDFTELPDDEILEEGPATPALYEDNLFTDHIRKRKELELEVHQTIGTLSPNLEEELYKIFGKASEFQNIPLINQEQIQTALNQDPIARKLSFEAQSKMMHLIFRGYARPYLAFLISRYMDEIINQNSSLDFNTLEKIDTIVLYYTIEWTIRSLVKHRLNALLPSEKAEVIQALLDPSIHKRTGGFNFSNLHQVTTLESLFESFLRQRENFIASTSLGLLIGTSIFD